MTDDDKILYPSFAKLFGSNIEHLICFWHVEQTWKQQLHNKVKFKVSQKEIFSKLQEMHKDNSRGEFHSLLDDFVKK